MKKIIIFARLKNRRAMQIKESELLEGKWIPRDGHIVVAVKPQTKGNLIIASNATASNETHEIIVVAVDPEIKDLKKGDKVIVTPASLIELPVIDLQDNKVSYAFTKHSFIKLVYHEDTN
jgi:hypothetical protein